MNILDQIVFDKRKEVDLRKKLIPVNQLENSVLFGRKSDSIGAQRRPAMMSLQNAANILPKSIFESITDLVWHYQQR